MMKALVFTTNNTAYSREFPEPLFESAHEVIDDLMKQAIETAETLLVEAEDGR